MSYQNPIKVMWTQLQNQFEGEIYKTVMKAGVNVDKEELLKALQYDREQYQKGYKDRDDQIIRCKDCKHWDKTTREEGNDCILGPWEDAVCDMFRDWDTYGDLGEDFRRTNGDWYCADGEREE